MLLTLVRHGETEWNRLQRCQGVSDIPLNENGIFQSKLLAESLKNEKIDAVFSSGLKRASSTAEAIAKFHGLEVGVDEDFREMDQGEFEGVEFSEIREKHSDKLKMWVESPASFRIPGGETLSEVQKRAMNGIENMLGKWTDAHIVVVSHNLTIVSMLCEFNSTPISGFRDFKISETSRTVVSCESGKYTVNILNDTSHLDDAAGYGAGA
ncbi:MAG: histidine phosphatase family protein [Thermodesulfobacteriota bacterium]